MLDDALACGLRCFTGRASELATLHAELERALRDRQPRFVLVEGDYGTGKTTLIERFIHEAQQAHGKLLVLRGQCVGDGSGDGRLPFRQALGALAAESVAQPVLRAAWEYLHTVGPEWLDFVTLGLASPLVHTADQVQQWLQPRVSRLPEESVFGQFANALLEASARRPVILFIEDLHWADESSLRLLFFLRQRLERAQILLITAYRPVEALHLGSHTDVFGDVVGNLLRQGVTPIALKRDVDAGSYLARRYGDLPWPTELLRRFAALGEGHPMFLYELPTLWETQGLLVRKGDGDWQLTGEPDLAALPTRLTALLDLRLGQVTERMFGLLKRGAVEGDEFAVQVVQALSGLDEEQVLEDLEALEQRYRLVRSDTLADHLSSDLDYCRFAHAFYSEYIHAAKLTPLMRRRFHRQAAECLERLHPEPARIADRLARHWELAGDRIQAARYALLAARTQRPRGAWAEVEHWASQGLQWLDSQPSPEWRALRLDLLQESAEGRHDSGLGLDAREQYVEALALAQALQAPAERIGVLCARLAEICDDEDEFDTARGYVGIGQAALVSQASPWGESHALLAAMQALLLSRAGDYEPALAVLQQALDLTQVLPMTDGLASATAGLYQTRGLTLGYVPRYAEGLDSYERAAQMADQVGDVYTALWSRVTLAEDALNSGQMERSIATLERVLADARRYAVRDVEGYALTVRAELRLEQGLPLDALGDLAQAQPMVEQAGQGVYVILADRALAYRALGERELARSYIQQAVEADDADAPGRYVLHALGRVESDLGDHAAALHHLEQAVAAYRAHGEPDYAARAQRSWALALYAAGQSEHARALCQEALAVFRGLGLEHQVRATQAALAQMG